MANWNDIKYGRLDDEAAIRADIGNLLKGLCSYLTGSRYANVIRVVRANWAGPDADAFIARFEKKFQTLQNELPKKYENKFYNVVKSNISAYRAAQARNADTMKF